MTQDTTKCFLEALFPEWPAGVFVEVRAFKDRKLQRHWLRSTSDLLDLTEKLKADHDIYFGIGPRRGRNGTREAVAYINTLWADLDMPVDETRRVLVDFELAPSAIISSGYGAHAYWLLRESYFVEGQKDIAYAEARLRGLACRLNADSCWDLPRVLRLPGSTNHKNKQTRPVEVVEFNSDRRYNLSDFDTWALEAEAVEAVEFEGDPIGGEEALQKAQAKGLSDPVLKIIVEGHAEGADRSREDFGVICQLVEAGLSNDEIRAIFAYYPTGTKYRERGEGDRYLAVTIAKARSQTAKERAPTTNPVTAGPPRTKLELPDDCLRGPFGKWVNLWRNHEGSDAYEFVNFFGISGLRLGRRARIYCGTWLNPNAYVVTYGPSGISRKSASQRHHRELLAAADPDVVLQNGIVSAEGLIDALGGSPDEENPPPPKRMLWTMEEIASLLKKARQESTSNIPATLTELYDCPAQYRLRTRGSPKIAIQPTLTILAASTAEWLESCLTDEQIMGGFANRFLYITGSFRPLVPLPREPDTGTWNRLLKALHDLGDDFSQGATFTLSPNAQALWEGFYRSWHEDTYPNEILGNIVQRIPDYVLKLAMVYAAWRSSATIQGEELDAAWAFGFYARDSVLRLFEGMHQSTQAKLENRIEELLQERGPMKRRDLHQAVGGRYSAKQFNDAVDALFKAGVLATKGDTLLLAGGGNVDGC
jgi:hypothetical protein